MQQKEGLKKGNFGTINMKKKQLMIYKDQNEREDMQSSKK